LVTGFQYDNQRIQKEVLFNLAKLANQVERLNINLERIIQQKEYDIAKLEKESEK